MCLEKDEFEFLYSLNEVEEPINIILKSKNHKIGIQPSKTTYNNYENSKNNVYDEIILKYPPEIKKLEVLNNINIIRKTLIRFAAPLLLLLLII